MKRQIVGFGLALVIGLACSQVISAQETKPQIPGAPGTKPPVPSVEIVRPAQPPVQTFSQDELAQRYYKTLEDSLEAGGACLSLRGANYLEQIVARGAQATVQEQRFGELPQADENLRFFARALIEQARKSGGGRITDKIVLGLIGNGPEKSTFCPLFPICK